MDQIVGGKLWSSGSVANDLSLLGEIPPDTGLTDTAATIFMAKVIDKQMAQPEDSESVENNFVKEL
jgi:hypothetical protein